MSEGTCGNVTINTDPKAVCGSYYYCDGSGSCATGCAGTCQTECKAASYCNGVSCVGLIAAGGGCARACECGAGVCTSVFVDSDGDTYGDPARPASFCGSTAAAGHSLDAGDCCDTDPRAQPNQATWFDTPRGCDGGFDFDCSGSIEQQFPAVGTPCPGTYSCCATSDCEGCQGGTRTTTPGWYPGPDAGACGYRGAYISGTCTSLPLQTSCLGQTGFWDANCNTATQSNVLQGCR